VGNIKSQNKKNNYSLKSKLTFTYIILVIAVVGVMTLVSNFGIRNRFKDYVIHRQEKQTHEIVELLLMNYDLTSSWRESELEIIGMNALQKGLIVELKDASGTLIWSALEHNNGLCHAMISDMYSNMQSYSMNWKGSYEEKYYDLKIDNKVIGELTTGYVGPYYFSDEELIFIKALNSILLVVGIGSISIAFLLGIIMSDKISKPLKKVAGKASSLSLGLYKERLDEVSTTKEINMLTDAINKLSDTLEYKEKLQQRLIQDVAHELRTPLTSVQGSMEAMIDGIWDMNTERLSSCYEEIIRLKRMIGSVETLSRVENDNVVMNKETFDLSKLISSILLNYDSKLYNKNMEANFNVDSVYIYGDKDKLTQVLNNLLSNAIAYSKDGGSIQISIEEENDKVKIRMKDNGVGISKEDLPHIFERFYRVDKSRSRSTGGLGIGLSITKGIITAHEGNIEVNSELGEGTEFIIELPNNNSL
jgi:two-component system sensor histidine kinase BaeS